MNGKGNGLSLQSLARTNYGVRTAAFAYCLLPIGLYLWEHGAGWQAWTLAALQFLGYPHLVYWRAQRSAHPARAELDNLFLDAALVGAWVAHLGFPAWIGFSFLGATMLNAAVNRGPAGAGLSFGCSLVGAALWAAVGGVRFAPETSGWVTFLCLAGSLAYSTGIGFVVWGQTRRLSGARAELRQSEERYRLIAENADDLVAMVDGKGRWLYTSPSYRRILDTGELALGADAFGRIHPDDAELGRAAVARAASTGKPRDVALRLVDREGRMRQYRVRLQPLAGAEPPHKVVLVSHDVTDLRESEEKVLLAAHALEGMTEAIMITAADGTILTVNRAFGEITGRTREEVLGQPEKAIRSGLLPPEFYDDAYARVQRDGYWSGTQWNRRKSGSVYREWRSVRSVKDEGGAVTHYVHVFYEVGSPRSAAGATTGPVGA
jgi:PAS domain S-box-containing protein